MIYTVNIPDALSMGWSLQLKRSFSGRSAESRDLLQWAVGL